MPRLFATLALSLAMIGCGGSTKTSAPASTHPVPPSSEAVGEPLATVNGISVGSATLDALVSARRLDSRGPLTAEQKQELLQTAIQSELLFQKAFEEGLYQDPKIRNILVNTLERQKVVEEISKTPPSEEELKEWFEENQAKFIIPEKRRTRRLFVSITNDRPGSEAQGIVEEYARQIAADPDRFAAIATEISDGPYAPRGGDLGFLTPDSRKGVPIEVTTMAYGLGVDEVSDPFLAGGGVNLIRVEEITPEVQKSFDQLKARVLREVQSIKYWEAREAYIEELTKGATISIDEGALAAWGQAEEAPKAQAASTPSPAPDGASAPGRPDIENPPEGVSPVDDENTVNGKPRTGDPIADEGDANDVGRDLMEEQDGF